jgi:hypothetical protein
LVHLLTLITAVFALKSMCYLINMLNVMTEGIVHFTGIAVKAA